MHIMLKQSICYEYLYIIWLLHTKNSYLKLYLHYQHCEFAFVIRCVYIYFEGCWQVPLKTWKIYFLRKKNWKVDIEGNYIEKYYSKIIFIAQNEGYVLFFFLHEIQINSKQIFQLIDSIFKRFQFVLWIS